MRWPESPTLAVDRQKWHRWFAWHPVTIARERVWLEVVERQGTFYYDSMGGSYSWEYRNAPTVEASHTDG